MKNSKIIAMILFSLTLMYGCSLSKPEERLACQAWTFHKFSFMEALDKMDSLGIKNVEAFPGQVLENGKKEVFYHTMSETSREFVKKELEKRGMILVHYGVVNGKDEQDWEAVFSFVRDMGIELIVIEPSTQDLDLVENLCKKYKIKAAIHNHPKPSRYWNPLRVQEALKNRCEYMGTCGDIGHWIRSGINPVEALKQLEGHLFSLHFKDLHEKGPKGHDVPWGSGVGELKQVMKELKRQKFNGRFVVEYEYNWENSVPEIASCLESFNDLYQE